MMRHYGSQCNICNSRFTSLFFLEPRPVETQEEQVALQKYEMYNICKKKAERRELKTFFSKIAIALLKVFPDLEALNRSEVEWMVSVFLQHYSKLKSLYQEILNQGHSELFAKKSVREMKRICLKYDTYDTPTKNMIVNVLIMYEPYKYIDSHWEL
jgi:hypothetical protein